jgi:CheY-like chemotaxis protein
MDMDSSRIMERIDIATRNLTHLIRALLDRSAIDLGRMTPQWSNVALARLLRDIADQNRLAAEHSGSAIRVICPATILVSCDQALLTNMIQNLVTNAIRYAPGSVILIGARRRGETVTVVVSDRGPGIDLRDQERIFEEFQIGGDPTETGAQAMPRSFGLGLSLVRQLAATMDLSVMMTSKLGRGTIFFIDGLRDAADGPNLAARASDVHPLNGVTVLAVDDDAATLEAITSLLRGWGCRVVASDKVPAAIPSQCRVVITDWQLADGTDAASFVSALRSGPGTPCPVLIVSGTDTEAIAARIKADPGILILEKPARPAQLRAALTSLLIARR